MPARLGSDLHKNLAKVAVVAVDVAVLVTDDVIEVDREEVAVDVIDDDAVEENDVDCVVVTEDEIVDVTLVVTDDVNDVVNVLDRDDVSVEEIVVDTVVVLDEVNEVVAVDNIVDV